MNTKQLIILWYGSFTIIVFLFLFYANNNSAFPLIVVTSISALVVLLFLTFRDSEKVDSIKIIKSSILPLGLVLGFTFVLNIFYSPISTHTFTFSKSIRVEDIEIISPQLTIENRSYSSSKIATFKGRLKNNSNRTLSKASFRVRIFQFDYKPREEIPDETELPSGYFYKAAYLPTVVDSLGKVREQIDSEEFNAKYLHVGSGEIKSFEVIEWYTDLQPSRSWAWDYEILSVSSSN